MNSEAEKEKNTSQDAVENGAYEIIKNRLFTQGNELKHRLDQLNEVRKDTFGSIERKVLGSERIVTDNNCIPRAMAPVDDYFIFGYNVRMGLKSKVELSDVFSIYRYHEKKLVQQTLELIKDEQFRKDCDELYEYYKNTFFAKFTIKDPYFYMIF